jgi:uncharacterized protein with HEPN domain
MTKEYGDYVYDIFEAMNDISDFVAGISFEEFSDDKKTVNAVIRSLEVIGEAAKRIPREFRINYPDIPWKKMTAMRDKLIHHYAGVDLEIVWVVITQEIKPLKPIFKDIISDLENTK